MDNTTLPPARVKDLIAALSELNPEAEVVINIKQANKYYGVVQLPVASKYNGNWKGPNEWAVDSSYGGACITVYLPDEAYVAKLPKD